MSDCIFCKIVAKQIPAKIVYEDDQVVCFHDIQPVAPVHVLLIPKKHFASHHDVRDEDWPVIAHLHKIAQQIAIEQGIAHTGYRLVNNCGSDAGQVVFHYHLHLLGGSKLTSLGHIE
jgi:histidine triad (HIT) family protein